MHIYAYIYIFIQYKHMIYVHLLVEKLIGRADCIAGQKGMATSLRKRYKQPFKQWKAFERWAIGVWRTEAESNRVGSWPQRKVKR